MTMQAAKDLRAKKEIGRIGYYRPEITVKGNTVTAIVGHAFIYPRREEAKATADQNASGTSDDDDTDICSQQTAKEELNIAKED